MDLSIKHFFQINMSVLYYLDSASYTLCHELCPDKLGLHAYFGRYLGIPAKIDQNLHFRAG